MLRPSLLFCAILALLAMQGCASMSPEACVASDWYQVGVADGEKGRVRERIARYQEDCGKAGIVPDVPRYMAGRDEGLRTYCTLPNAIEVGKRGGSYNGVCPPDLQDDFVAGFRAGLAIDQAEDSMLSVRTSIREAESSLSKSGATEEQKSRLRSEIFRLERELIRLEGERDRATSRANELLLARGF